MNLKINQFSETVITATRKPYSTKHIPYHIQVISEDDIKSSAKANVDNILRQAAGVQVFRPLGKPP